MGNFRSTSKRFKFKVDMTRKFQFSLGVSKAKMRIGPLTIKSYVTSKIGHSGQIEV